MASDEDVCSKVGKLLMLAHTDLRARSVGTGKAHAGALAVSTRGQCGSQGAKFGGQRALGRGR